MKQFLSFLAFYLVWAHLACAQEQAKTVGNIFQKSDEMLKDFQSHLENAKKDLDAIENDDTYKLLTNGKKLSLPIKIPLKNPSDKYQIGLSSLTIGPKNAAATVYMRLDPKVFSPSYKGSELYFGAKDILFTKNGGFSGDATMVLLDSVVIPMGQNVKLTFYPQNKIDKSVTYATFDCDGFKELHVSGAITFAKEIMQKEDASGKTINGDVKFYFETTIKDWDDWIIEINQIPMFQLTQLGGFSWKVDAFVLDKSLSRNSSDFVIPDGYKLNGLPEMWNGVFFRNITVKLPKEFKGKKRQNDERITISGSYFLIDQSGISGKLLTTNIIPDGELGRWTYSLDTVKAEFRQDVLSGAGFAGTLDMPLAKDKKDGKFGLAYSGSITRDPNNQPVYHFNVGAKESFDFSFWKAAKVELHDTQISVESSNGNFRGDFKTSGKITVTPTFGKKSSSPTATETTSSGSPSPSVSSPAPADNATPAPTAPASEKDTSEGPKSATAFAVSFEELHLSSYANYFQGIKSVNLESNGTSLLSKLPVQAKNGQAVREDHRLGLRFDLEVNFIKAKEGSTESANAFSGGGQITIWAKEDVESGKWRYDKTDLGSICLNAPDNGGFSFNGCVTRYQGDPMYGEGFEGKLEAKFKPNIIVQVSAMFGRKSSTRQEPDNVDAMLANYTESPNSKTESVTYRYWYVDASVEFNPIPIFTGIGLNKFMGGAYHHMTREQPKNGVAVDCDPNELGCSKSKTRFLPDSSIFLGVRAGVGIVCIPTAAVFSGNLLFGIEFLEGGGVKKIYFDGMAKFVDVGSTINADKIMAIAKSVDSTGGSAQACETGLAVTWKTEYDFPLQTFSGTFDVKVNLANVIQGNLDPSTCVAGRIEVYFSPQDWYLYVGRPDVPTGIQVAGLLSIKSYFIVGSKLPDPPIAPMPDGIPGTPVRSELLPNGGGLGFGVRAGATVNLGFDVSASKGCGVGAGVNAGFEFGFDVLIAKDKTPVNCPGYNPRGINNWYATGQIYLVAWGRIYVSYDCPVPIGDGSFDLMELRMAAWAFGQLPNPTYLRGGMDVSAKILSVVNIHFKFDFKYGNECQGDDAKQRGFELVERISPWDTLEIVPVYTCPSATLKKAVNSSFMLNTSGNEGKDMAKVTIGMPIFTVKAYSLRTKTTSTIDGKVKLDQSSTTVTFLPDKVLPDSSIISVQLEIPFSNGSNSVKNWKFQTMTEQDKIEISNIAQAYPLPNMKNVYRSSSASGYIQLRTLPERPLTAPAGYGFAIRYLKGNTLVYSNAVKINKVLGKDQIEFTIPSDKLENSTTYTLQLVKTRALLQTQQTDGDGSSSGMINEGSKDDVVVLEYPFTTSVFATFVEKMGSFKKGTVNLANKDQGIISIGMDNQTSTGASLSTEGFSEEEIRGYRLPNGEMLPPLIQFASMPKVDYDFGRGFQTEVTSNDGFKGLGSSPPQNFPPYDAIQLASGANGYVISYEVPKYIKSGLLFRYMEKGTDDHEKYLQASTGGGNVLMNTGVYSMTSKYTLPGKPGTVAGEISISFDLKESVSY